MPFSDEYFRMFERVSAFHDRVTQRYQPAATRSQISERLLRCIWYDGLYDEKRLATSEGKDIVVHSPGTWNLEAGPDFRNADISIGGRRTRGDVELHIEPAAWRHHGHSGDSRYDNVILHVTLGSRRDSDNAVTRHGVEIPEIALWDRLADELKVLKCTLRPDDYPYRSTRNFGRCRDLLEQMPDESAQRLLCIAGDARMIVKQQRFGYESEKNEIDQVAYSAMLEAIGYKAFRESFGRLARKLPYVSLRDAVDSAPSDGDGHDSIRLTQALLLGAAGFVSDSDAGMPSDADDYFGSLRRLWADVAVTLPAGEEIEWKAPAVRPANRPERRIAGVSHVLARSYARGLFKSILACIAREDPKKAKRTCLDFLMEGDDDFWSYHYSMGGKTLPKPVSLIGRSRALTIVVNLFVPLGLLDARSHEDGDEEPVHQLYGALPSLPPNNITRLMEYRLFGKDPKQRVARSARTQQGLLQIFADWCSEDPSCENCGVYAGLESGFIQ